MEPTKGPAAQPGLSRNGLITILLTIYVVFMIVVPEFYQMRQDARIASCMNDIKMLHVPFEKYAEEHDGRLPPISPVRGNLAIDPEGFYPDYLPNSCWLQCEWSKTRRQGEDKSRDLGREGFNDDSFVYIPWEIQSEAEALAFVEAYKHLDLKDRDKDLKVTIDGEMRVLPRTRLIPWNASLTADTDPVPVFIEWSDHYHQDAVVLLSNGAATRREFSDPFPISDTFLAALRKIAALDDPLPDN